MTRLIEGNRDAVFGNDWLHDLLHLVLFPLSSFTRNETDPGISLNDSCSRYFAGGKKEK